VCGEATPVVCGRGEGCVWGGLGGLGGGGVFAALVRRPGSHCTRSALVRRPGSQHKTDPAFKPPTTPTHNPPGQSRSRRPKRPRGPQQRHCGLKASHDRKHAREARFKIENAKQKNNSTHKSTTIIPTTQVVLVGLEKKESITCFFNQWVLLGHTWRSK
jgi:hypothetical protein